jgi:Zn-dependent peptidase ImmA (M78 family)
VKKFRRLPDYELEKFSDDTFKKIRIAQGFQDSLPAILEGQKNNRKIFNELKPNGISIKKFAQQARTYIGITTSEQFKFQSSSIAFKQWRHVLEEAGIFTFKDTLKDLFISGFSLLDDEYPIIFINNSNSFSRQIFTLIHELGHILFGVNGITEIDETYFSYLNSSEHKIEILCNQFASEFLVPDDEFKNDIIRYEEEGIDAVSEIAYQYSVSREVILRKLLDKNIVSEALYLKQSQEWNKEYLRAKQKTSGGNYYLTKISYLGEYFTKAAFTKYHRGQLGRTALANHLNCKSKNLNKLEANVRW